MLGPGRIFVFFLFIACFITFYVHTALQQKQQQHQRIIYCMHYRSLHPRSEYRMYANRIQIRILKPKFKNLNFV